MVVVHCIVPSCNNTSVNAGSKLFISIPKNPMIRKAWAVAMNMCNIPYSGRDRVCEDHFNLEEDSDNWMRYKIMGTSLHIKPEVVPHRYINSPPRQKLPSQLSDSARKRKREFLDKPTSGQSKQIKLSPKVVTSPTTSAGGVVTKSVSSSGIFKVSPVSESDIRNKRAVVHNSQVLNIKKFVNKETNTDTVEHTSVGTMTIRIVIPEDRQKFMSSPSTSSITKTTSDSSEVYLPSTSSTMCSEYDNYKYSVHQDTRRDNTVQLIELNCKFYLGLPKTVYILVKLLESWASIYYVDVLITLKKIKQNDVYTRLAHDFGMSVSNVQRIFTNSVPKIANVMQSFIFSPDEKIIKRLLPIPFRLRYSDVFSIIDCLEIEIEKPSNPLKQSLTWSEYKKCNTLKFLISSTPNGFINYISGGFGGRISDKNIIEYSGYINFIPTNVSIMADRGFKQISGILDKKNCKLVKPPSVSAKTKSSRGEVRVAKRIAALRIHIERVIRRIREFEMLHMHSGVNNNLLYLMNHILIIACGLINVQEPLIK